MKNLLARLLSYLMNDWEAHKRAAQMNTSANEVHLRKELEKYKSRTNQAEKHVVMFTEMSNQIIKNAFSVPDEQMLPFVHETVITIENRMRYLDGTR